MRDYVRKPDLSPAKGATRTRKGRRVPNAGEIGVTGQLRGELRSSVPVEPQDPSEDAVERKSAGFGKAKRKAIVTAGYVDGGTVKGTPDEPRKTQAETRADRMDRLADLTAKRNRLYVRTTWYRWDSPYRRFVEVKGRLRLRNPQDAAYARELSEAISDLRDSLGMTPRHIVAARETVAQIKGKLSAENARKGALAAATGADDD